MRALKELYMEEYNARQKVYIMMKNIGGLSILWGYQYTEMLRKVAERLKKNKTVVARDEGTIDTLWNKYIELNNKGKEIKE